MQDNRGRIEAGQRIGGAISARAWNRAQDAADLVLGATLGTSATLGPAGKAPYTWCYCKPDVTAARWTVLAITGMAIAPTAEAGVATASFEEMPTITGGTPSATTTAWCVAVEPIAANKVGRVAVGGVVQMKKSQLSYALGAQVLWSGPEWLLIRFGSGFARGTFTAPWAKGDTKEVIDAVDTSKHYGVVKNYFATVSGAGQKACAIAFIGNEWILIAAEC